MELGGWWDLRFGSGALAGVVWVCLCLCVLEEEEDDKSELVLQMEKRGKKKEPNVKLIK